jgi:hypothetical protein
VILRVNEVRDVSRNVNDEERERLGPLYKSKVNQVKVPPEYVWHGVGKHEHVRGLVDDLMCKICTCT